MAFQNGVDEILKTLLSRELTAGNATYSEGAYAVVMNPTLELFCYGRS